MDKILTKFSASELARLIATKEVSPVDVMRGYLDRIERYDSDLNSYITICKDDALEEAKKAEKAVMDGEVLGPLHGLPLGVKDQFETKGVLTTASSKILANYVPNEDATIVARAKEAGAILLGKLNMSPFVAGGGDYLSRENPPRNPWNFDRDPGSSSHGSGIAIAASLCSIAFGEDTGGSIRGPAALNGIVGLRPTWGRVSRHGLLLFCWSMDAGGPMTRTVEDTALVMNAIAGYDPKDSLTSKLPVPDYTKCLTTDVRGLRAGLLMEFMEPGFTSEEVRKSIRDAVSQLEAMGVVVEEVSLPMLLEIGDVRPAISESDGAFIQRKWIVSNPKDFGKSALKGTLVGSMIPNYILEKAARMRALLRREWAHLLRQYDFLISPTTLTEASKIHHYTDKITSREQAEHRFGGRRTPVPPAALAGTPAITVPCGFSKDGLPIGLQIIGGHFREDSVIKLAYAYEQETKWHTMRPIL